VRAGGESGALALTAQPRSITPRKQLRDRGVDSPAEPVAAELGQQLQGTSWRTDQSSPGWVHRAAERLDRAASCTAKRQAPLLAAAEPLRCMLHDREPRTHLVKHGLELLGRRPTLKPRFQFLGHAFNPSKLTLRKLKNQTAEASGAWRAFSATLPADFVPPLGRGQAAGSAPSGGLTRAAAAATRAGSPGLSVRSRPLSTASAAVAGLVTPGLGSSAWGPQVVTRLAVGPCLDGGQCEKSCRWTVQNFGRGSVQLAGSAPFSPITPARGRAGAM